MSLLVNIFMIYVLSINIKFSSLSIISEIQKSKICFKSDTNEIPEGTYQDFLPSNSEKGNNENLLSMIL